ncbi:hypothetical protein H5410_041182 [Solanum commersonii]|uniref:Uncharacterized protein n=1 Tax=Solanum commersonii TaxID=4109 RepID=A0A9J5XTS4_SOLCO|nr:hypothetical protein H5410_041182 [Solanum commersonii]
MEKMVELVMKGGGNRQCVQLIDVTEENHQINDTCAYVEKKITGEDYALVCERLFRNRGLSVGDEIELYWDIKFHKFIIKCVELTQYFIRTNIEPDWMIFGLLPILPHHLRMIIQIDICGIN